MVGVELRLQSGDAFETAFSDPDGTYQIALNAPPDVSAMLYVDKPGSVPQQQTYAHKPDGDQDFCLEPQP